MAAVAVSGPSADQAVTRREAVARDASDDTVFPGPDDSPLARNGTVICDVRLRSPRHHETSEPPVGGLVVRRQLESPPAADLTTDLEVAQLPPPPWLA